MKTGKAALVTGGAGRLGKAMSLKLADLGYDIALQYNKAELQAEQTKEEITRKGVVCDIFKADFLVETDVEKLIQRVNHVFDLKILINNTSEFIPSNISDIGIELFMKLLRINFLSAYTLTKSFTTTKQNGLVINMLDSKINKNTSKHFDYLLTKKFLKIFTEMAAMDLAPHFRVNAIAPGLILPPKEKEPGYLKGLSLHIPMKSTGTLKQIEDAMVFFVNNDFTTGQTLFIDGGEHL
ncbi:MAG: SDR family oxidoreductase [Nitrospira sp.]|nr:SDR family oxidoreductase [Candidatus Manganitrophaceae bacterium]HIL34853.1 SDR family oxidoreductase [Candidatus Manganitrophaceae bacterium]